MSSRSTSKRGTATSGTVKSSSTESTFKSCSVLSFWIIIVVLFVFSYKTLNSQSSNTNRSANVDKKDFNDQHKQQELQIVSPNYLNAIEGVDLVLKGIAVSSDSEQQLETELELRVDTGSLREAGNGLSQRSFKVRGSSNSIQEQMATKKIMFRGSSDTHLTIEFMGRVKRVPITVLPARSVVQKDVSLLIKTHERPSSLELLVESIRKFYPDIAILVADDSKTPTFKTNINIQYYPLEYDLGLSASRNFLLDQVRCCHKVFDILRQARTPYVMSLDDDFVFTEETKIERLFQVLQNHDVDLVSGSLFTDTNGELYDYAGNIAIEGDSFKLVHGDHGSLQDEEHPVCKRYDIVANFFMADLEKLKQLKWDPKLKLGEHQDFFLRAKQNNLKVASCFSEVAVLHKQDHSNPEYKQKRGREVPYLRQFLKKHGLKKFVLYSGLTYVWVLDE